MNYRKVTAFVQSDLADRVTERLREIGVHGMSLCDVRGCGEYANLWGASPDVAHTRLEIFIPAEQAEKVAQAIMEAAHTGGTDDGIVAVSPVDVVYRIRNRQVMG